MQLCSCDFEAPLWKEVESAGLDPTVIALLSRPHTPQIHLHAPHRNNVGQHVTACAGRAICFEQKPTISEPFLQFPLKQESLTHRMNLSVMHLQ